MARTLFSVVKHRTVAVIARLITSALLGGLSACGSGSNMGDSDALSSERSIYVSYYRNGCVGELNTLCLQVEEKGGHLGSFYGGIEGFRFEWGYRYQLRVRTDVVAYPLMDGSSVKFTLLQETERRTESSRDEFSVWLPGAHLLRATSSANIYRLADDKEFICQGADCASLDALIAQQFWFLLVFKLGDTPDDPLILQRIACSDAQVSFRESCLGSNGHT